MGIDDESSHPELCSEVADGVTQNIVCLFREPDAVTPPVRFDKRGCGNVALVRLLRHRQTKGPVSARPHLNRRATPRLHHERAVKLRMSYLWGVHIPSRVV